MLQCRRNATRCTCARAAVGLLKVVALVREGLVGAGVVARFVATAHVIRYTGLAVVACPALRAFAVRAAKDGVEVRAVAKGALPSIGAVDLVLARWLRVLWVLEAPHKASIQGRQEGGGDGGWTAESTSHVERTKQQTLRELTFLTQLPQVSLPGNVHWSAHTVGVVLNAVGIGPWTSPYMQVKVAPHQPQPFARHSPQVPTMHMSLTASLSGNESSDEDYYPYTSAVSPWLSYTYTYTYTNKAREWAGTILPYSVTT